MFSIVLEADLEHDLLVVRSADGAPLPVEERLQREATWRQFGASGPGVDPVPVTLTPWTMYAPVMGDITLTGRSASDGSSSLDYNGLVVGELAWLTHEFYVSGQVGEGPGDLRLTSGRRDYNGGVFGVPTLYEAVVGDVLGHTIPLVGRPAMGRGFSLGGRPLAQPTEFDATRVEGDALPGWAAELYRNNELISVQTIGANGRYRFDDVALNFGRNQLLVRLYGPQGQMREVVETIGVGADMAPPGSFRWAAFLDQPDQRLFDALLDRQPRHDAVAGGVSFDVGLTRNLSAGASVARAPISSRAGSDFASYGGVVLYAGVGPVAFETAATASDAAGWAWRLAALTSIGPASLSVRHEEYEDGYRSLDSELGFNALRRFSRVRLSAPLSWLAPGLGSVSLTSDKFEHATGRREWAARGNWRVDLFGAHFDHGVEYRDIRQVDGTTFDEAFYVGAAALTRGPLSGRAQMRYRLTGDQGLQTYDVSVQYRLSETLILSAGVFRDEFSRRTGGSLGVSRDLGFAYLNLDGSWDDDGRYAIGAGLTFSFGFDSSGGARLASQPQARMGAIEPFVFLDRAGDGRYQAGEDEPLADVQLLVNGYPAPNAMTTRDGRAWLAGLSVGEPIRLAVDTASLPDAFLAPSQAEIAVQPRPGRAFRLEIPVVETGEISGVVEVVDAARREPLRGLRLELVNEQGEVRGTAVSMIDGAWLFGQVPPGRWIVRAAPSQTVRGAPVSPAFVHTAVRPDHLIVEGLGFQLEPHRLFKHDRGAVDARWREVQSMTQSKVCRPNVCRPVRTWAVPLFLVGLGVLLAPTAARAQACTAVTFDPPISGQLDFGRLYVSAGPSGTATLNPATGFISTTGRLVAAQTGAAMQVRVTDASPDCEFLLTIAPSSQNLATAFTAVADRITVLEGTLLNADPGQREWLVRMNDGVARIAVGGVLEMNTSATLIDSYATTFTVSADPP